MNYNSVARHPLGIMLNADSVTEYQATRLLLLLHVAGGSLDVVRRMPKVDFFSRFPDSHPVVDALLRRPTEFAVAFSEFSAVEARYAPWDRRYNQVLANLRTRRMLRVEQSTGGHIIVLLPNGRRAIDRLLSTNEMTKLLRDISRAYDLVGAIPMVELNWLIRRLLLADRKPETGLRE